MSSGTLRISIHRQSLPADNHVMMTERSWSPLTNGNSAVAANISPPLSHNRMMHQPNDRLLCEGCTLRHDTGDTFASSIYVDLRFRKQSTIRPDKAALWYGTLIPSGRLDVGRFDLFFLAFQDAAGGMIQIQGSPSCVDNTIQFNGVGKRPRVTDPPDMAAPTKRCDECESPFFAPSSRMDGLCPECAHHLYGYSNCSHVFVSDACELCGWDGSVSTFVQSLK